MTLDDQNMLQVIKDFPNQCRKALELPKGLSIPGEVKNIVVCGMGGSVAIELVTLLEEYQKEPLKLPERYRRLGYYVVRTLVAFAAGGLALAYEIDKPLLALNVGASAPLLVQALARGLPEGSAEGEPG